MTAEIIFFAAVLAAALLGGLFGLITHLGLGATEPEAAPTERTAAPAAQPDRSRERQAG